MCVHAWCGSSRCERGGGEQVAGVGIIVGAVPVVIAVSERHWPHACRCCCIVTMMVVVRSGSGRPIE